MPNIGDFGIELESELISVSRFKLRKVGNIYFNVTGDASCETIANNLFERPVIGKEIDGFPLPKKKFGFEVRTNIISGEEDYLPALKILTNHLIELGEPQKSYRAGFHVHVNTPFNLQVLKNLLIINRNLEQVFFLLGGMGYDYRGIKNDSTYCRPITGKGPLIVKTPKGYAQSFTIEDVLNAETMKEFKYLYGNINVQDNSHYIPVRYHFLNLVSVFTQGSTEFRIFNKSLNPHFLKAVIEFCKTVVDFAIASSFYFSEPIVLKENSIYDYFTKESIVQIFDEFCARSSFYFKKPREYETLLEIMELGDIDSIKIPNQFVYSHLMFHPDRGDITITHWVDEKYMPKIIERSEIKKPEFVDWRVLQRMERA